MRAEVLLRTVEGPLIGRLGVYTIEEIGRRRGRRILPLLAHRQIAPVQHASIGSGDDVAKRRGINRIGCVGVELGDVSRDQPSTDREHDRPHGSGLGHGQARPRRDTEPLLAAGRRLGGNAGGGNLRAELRGEGRGERVLARSCESRL
jgi:hypothetical protein